MPPRNRHENVIQSYAKIFKKLFKVTTVVTPDAKIIFTKVSFIQYEQIL